MSAWAYFRSLRNKFWIIENSEDGDRCLKEEVTWAYSLEETMGFISGIQVLLLRTSDTAEVCDHEVRALVCGKGERICALDLERFRTLQLDFSPYKCFCAQVTSFHLSFAPTFVTCSSVHFGWQCYSGRIIFRFRKTKIYRRNPRKLIL